MKKTAALLGKMNALGDPTRARLASLVEQAELSVGELCSVLQLPQSTVSRHLKLLLDAGWVAVRTEGTNRLYRLATSDLEPGSRGLWAIVRETLAASREVEEDARRLAALRAERESRSQAFFRSVAGQWDGLRRSLFGDGFDLAALGGLLDETWELGDLGCGTGQMTSRLAPFVSRIVAIDSSRQMIAAARRRLRGLPNVEVRQGRLEALPLPDASLDAALLCLVLHHVNDPAAVLREAARVLRPTGRLLVVDMEAHDRREYREKMGHAWLGFEAPVLEAWMQAAGLDHLRHVSLPPAPEAKGPALFAVTARAAATSVRKPTTSESRRRIA